MVNGGGPEAVYRPANELEFKGLLTHSLATATPGFVSSLWWRLDDVDRVGGRKSIFQSLFERLFEALPQVIVFPWIFIHLEVVIRDGVIPMIHQGFSRAGGAP